MTCERREPFSGLTRPDTGPPPRSFGWVDLAILGLFAGMIYAVVAVAREWSGPLHQVSEIHLEARYLPVYALYSLSRGVAAYGISLLFTLVYGYVMARVSGAERVMLPVLDTLQSIPVLGFLPGFVLGLAHLFPARNIGLEIASILMIFTGQVWNMTFAFYASLKAVPPDLGDVARLSRMSGWERFRKLDLSFAASPLIWNSMMSMAGGWFFLMVSEAFVLGSHDFRLPGLGSYMSLALERGDGHAQLYGVVAMLGMIGMLDQFVWRPLLGWSKRFTDEESPAPSGGWMGLRFRGSWIVRVAADFVSKVTGWFRHFEGRGRRRTGTAPLLRPWQAPLRRWMGWAVVGVVATGGGLGLW